MSAEQDAKEQNGLPVLLVEAGFIPPLEERGNTARGALIESGWISPSSLMPMVVLRAFSTSSSKLEPTNNLLSFRMYTKP